LADICIVLAFETCQSKFASPIFRIIWVRREFGEIKGDDAVNILLMNNISKKLWAWELLVLAGLIMVLAACFLTGR
jgi:hypothetical protein